MPKVTNPDCLPSNCETCSKRVGDYCKLTKKTNEHIKAAQANHPRCMYWEVG